MPDLPARVGQQALGESIEAGHSERRALEDLLREARADLATRDRQAREWGVRAEEFAAAREEQIQEHDSLCR